jgi:hypothetical protein
MAYNYKPYLETILAEKDTYNPVPTCCKCKNSIDEEHQYTLQCKHLLCDGCNKIIEKQIVSGGTTCPKCETKIDGFPDRPKEKRRRRPNKKKRPAAARRFQPSSGGKDDEEEEEDQTEEKKQPKSRKRTVEKKFLAVARQSEREEAGLSNKIMAFKASIVRSGQNNGNSRRRRANSIADELEGRRARLQDFGVLAIPPHVSFLGFIWKGLMI